MILAFMQFSPAPDGYGGMQRAWHLLQALAAEGPVHLVLLQQPAYRRAPDLARVREMATSVTEIAIPAWDPASRRIRGLPKRIGRWLDLARIGTIYAPRLGRRTLRAIAAQLPVDRADTLFAGRLSCAAIADQLIDAELLSASCKLADFDDIQSRFHAREAAAARGRLAFDRALLDGIEHRRIVRAEARTVGGWDAVSVCSEDDRKTLAADYPAARIAVVPNVIDRPLLPPAPADPSTLLFIGNLGFGPNTHGLERFVREGWPRVRAACPALRFQVVGLDPPASLAPLLSAAGIELHANVPSVEPFYAGAAAVIAPILFGGGTRIKILEAMAHGRPVVATTIGAEGLRVEPGRDALIADTMGGLADAVIRLAGNAELRQRIGSAGRALQQARFGPDAMLAAVRTLLPCGRPEREAR